MQDFDIYLVDDEPHNLELLRRTLFGFRVHLFEQPRQALLSALANHPTCMVIDEQMPLLSGVELARECRIGGYEGTLLMVTAFPERNEVLKAGEAQLLYRIISKPIRADALREEVQLAVADSRFRRHLEGRRRRPRFVIGAPLEIAVGGAWRPVSVEDVSISGARLACELALESQVSLRLRGSNSAFESAARVVRVGADGTAIEFVNPSAVFRRAIGVLVTRHRYPVAQPAV